MHRWRVGGGCGLRRGRRGPGSVCVVRSRSVLRLPCVEKQEAAGQEAWEAGAIAMIEIQPRSGGGVNCSPHLLSFLKRKGQKFGCLCYVSAAKRLIVACPRRVEGQYVICGGCRGLAMSGVSLPDSSPPTWRRRSCVRRGRRAHE